jgi:23S rRNA (pseudouridine1915-N3)-methyltransferase
MRLLLLAVGTRQPGWVNDGFREYARRLPAHCPLKLLEIPAAKRGKTNDTGKLRSEEAERLLKKVPAGARVIVLDEHGKSRTTHDMAMQVDDWLRDGRDVAFIIGGPDGLDKSCLDRAEWHWSLSSLTLPHGLARVIVAEQLYRAWSLREGHPYHRA